MLYLHTGTFKFYLQNELKIENNLFIYKDDSNKNGI